LRSRAPDSRETGLRPPRRPEVALPFHVQGGGRRGVEQAMRRRRRRRTLQEKVYNPITEGAGKS